VAKSVFGDFWQAIKDAASGIADKPERPTDANPSIPSGNNPIPESKPLKPPGVPQPIKPKPKYDPDNPELN
jgi:hypothetical protein